MGEPDKRVRDVHELPDEPVRCAAAGRHVGFFFNDPHHQGGRRLRSTELPPRAEHLAAEHDA
jgi:hypothetical protein